METRTGRSGELFATNDPLIEDLINDPNYDVRPDGTVWTLITETGKISVNGIWRKAGHDKPKQDDEPPYTVMKYGNRMILVHRVIYRKFKGPLAEDLVVNHKNSIRTDNHPDNLELVTQSQNNLHRYRVGGKAPVKGNAKLTDANSKALRADYRLGMSYRQLMEKYKLKSKGTINAVLNHFTWPDPSDPYYSTALEIRHRKIDGKVAESIRQERRFGVSVKALMHKYGLQRTAIKDIIAGRTWKEDDAAIEELLNPPQDASESL